MIITIIGVVTWSEEWNEHFSQFYEAMQKSLLGVFPEFQPIDPPITVTMDDISPDDVIFCPMKGDKS